MNKQFQSLEKSGNQPLNWLRDYFYDSEIQLLYAGIKKLFACEWRHNEVWGDFWRLYYSPNKDAFVRFKSRTFNFDPEKILLIAPRTKISTDNPSPALQLYAHFLTNIPLGENKPRIIELDISIQEHGLLDRINESAQKEHCRHLLFPVYMQSFLLLLMGRVIQEDKYFKQPSEKLNRILEYIRKNLHLNLSNDSLAKWANINAKSLSRLFKSHLGSSPGKFIRQKRIRKACILLEKSEKSLEQIAEETGFYDRYHMSKVFTAGIGIPPASFRKKVRGKVF